MAEAAAFVVHRNREEAKKAALQMEEGLRGAGWHVFYPQRGETSPACRIVITFGGDGTLLVGARSAIRYGCPLLGIHLGTVGFLTEGDPEQLKKLMTAVLNSAYTTERRGLLRVTVNRNRESFLALNDAVVTRGGFARLIQVETRVNQEHWGTFIADGVIAATPTGSTGYSLSAGGPVVAPGVECMVITPVCAHSLQHCPCIVPRDAEIIFHLGEGREQRAELQIDGQNMGMLEAGDSVRITGADETLQLARIGDYHFFQVLQTKLNEWSQPRGETR